MYVRSVREMRKSQETLPRKQAGKINVGRLT
jgi:hypothetical protein